MEIIRLSETRPGTEGVTRQEPPKDLLVPGFAPDKFDWTSISTAPTPFETKMGEKIVDFFKKAGRTLKGLFS